MMRNLTSFVAIFSLISTVALAYKPNYYSCVSSDGKRSITYESDRTHVNYMSTVESLNLEAGEFSNEKQGGKIVISGTGSALWADQTAHRKNRDVRISIVLDDVNIARRASSATFTTMATVSFPPRFGIQRIPMTCTASKVLYNYHPATRR